MKYRKSTFFCCTLFYTLMLYPNTSLAERTIVRRANNIVLNEGLTDQKSFDLFDIKRKIEQQILEIDNKYEKSLSLYKKTKGTTFATILESYLGLSDLDATNMKAIDIKYLSFLFQLCNSIYVEIDDHSRYLNERGGDLSYERHRKSLETKRKTLEAQNTMLENIVSQIENLSKESNVESTKKLVEKQSVKTKGEHEIDEKNLHKNKEKGNIVIVQNTMGARYLELLDSYKKLGYGGHLQEGCSIDQFTSDVSKQKTEIENQILELNRLLEIYNNENVKIYDTKLRTIAQGHNPVFQGVDTAVVQDVFYRSGEEYLKKGIRKAFAAMKAAENSKKQLSGAILKVVRDTSNVDFYFVFSGSNSSADWEHNLKLFNKGGGTDTGILAGLNTHPGFRDSVSESIKEFGTKIQCLHKSVDELIKKNRQNGKPTNIECVFTGHSLGGALAICFAYQLHDMFTTLCNGAPDVTLKFKVYTFGAPPVFDKKSATTVASTLGSSNIVRVFNERDPVANLSFLKSKTGHTALSSLLNYHHIGIPVPLSYNIGTDIKTFGENLDLWAPHLARAYTNLLVTNNDELQKIFNSVMLDTTVVDLRQLCSYKKHLESLKQELEKLNNGGIINITNDDFFDFFYKLATAGVMIEKSADKLDPSAKKIKSINVTISHGGKNRSIEINRSTSCDSTNIFRKMRNNLKKAERKDVDKLIDSIKKSGDTKKVECKCCLMKKLFVTDDHGFRGKLDKVKMKDNYSFAGIIDQCDGHCDKSTKDVLLPNSKTAEEAFKDIAIDMELEKEWEKLQLR